MFMQQLQFNNSFEAITFEVKPFLIDSKDIPSEIIAYFKTKTDRKAIYEEKSNLFYCANCFGTINQQKCPNCHQNYILTKSITEDNYLIIDDISQIKDFRESFYYYFFQIEQGEIILYQVLDYLYYNNPFSIEPYKTHTFKINGAYHVTQKGIFEVYTDKLITFAQIDKANTGERLNLDSECYSLLKTGYLYLGNIKQLALTIYRYSHLWQAQEYLKDEPVNLLSLTYTPIHCPAFEYLINIGFYSLAFDEPYFLKYDYLARNLLKRENGYLDFMIANKFNYKQFLILKLVKCQDLNLINFYADYVNIIEYLLTISKLNLFKLEKYFNQNNLDQENLIDYCDYLCFADALGLNLNDPQILYPVSFWPMHDQIMEEYYASDAEEEAEIMQNIKKIGRDLAINQYEDDKYIIYPAPSLEALIAEGKAQNNCVRTYAKAYAKNKTHIYFMRQKSNLTKSFVTIEEKNGQIIQARIKNNKEPDAKVLKIITNWSMMLKEKN